MLNQIHKTFLSDANAFWMASASPEKIPDIVRCLGVGVENDTTIRCFFGEKFSARFRNNILANPHISMYGTNVFTLAGYQYKGQVLEVVPCTPDEVAYQKSYMEKFVDILLQFGFEREPTFKMYYSQPSLALQIKVGHIFDQMPKQNTGGEINSTLLSFPSS